MPESDTSTEVNFKLYDKKGKIDESKKTSDTDYYFNMIANDDKTIPEKIENVESSEIPQSDSESSKSTTSVKKYSDSSSSKSSKKSMSSKYSTRSRDRFDTVNFSNKPTTIPVTASAPSFSTSNTSSFIKPKVTQQLSPQETRMKKIELLRKLSEIKQKGFSLTKDYDFNSSLEEMEYEYELLKSFVDKKNGIRIYKNILLNGVSIVEFLNEKYDPFDFHLEGWGEHMSVEADSYDEVLEELYEKYKGTGKGMPPEIKLVLLLVASGSAYHFSKSQSTIPGLESALNKNPELISRLINPQKQKSNFMSPQEMNIEKQKEKENEMRKQMREQQQQMQQMQQQMQRQQAQAQSQQQMPIQMQQQMPVQASKPSFMNAPTIGEPRKTVSEINVPDNVRAILNRIKTSTTLAGTTDTQDSVSNNERLLSVENASESKKGKKKNMSIPSISINT
jgi:hypothetical protein